MHRTDGGAPSILSVCGQRPGVTQLREAGRPRRFARVGPLSSSPALRAPPAAGPPPPKRQAGLTKMRSPSGSGCRHRTRAKAYRGPGPGAFAGWCEMPDEARRFSNTRVVRRQAGRLQPRSGRPPAGDGDPAKATRRSASDRTSTRPRAASATHQVGWMLPPRSVRAGSHGCVQPAARGIHCPARAVA